MHEMLGNHHFLLRDYETALSHYETAMHEGNAGVEVRKRALVCYIQGHRIPEAIPLFEGLIRDDLASIVKHNQERYGCPCPEIIEEYERSIPAAGYSQTDRIALGMLWLFCDRLRSEQLFAEALRCDPDSALLKSVNRILKGDGPLHQSSSSHRTPQIGHTHQRRSP